MAALTASREVDHFVDQELRSFKVAAAKKIFKGSFVGLDSNGFAQPLIAGNSFAGLSFEEVDNAVGADGDKSVRLYTVGDFVLTVTGVTQAKVGDAVFAADDGTATLTGASNSFIGHVEDFSGSGSAIVRLATQPDPAATIADPTGGATVDAEARTAIDSILLVLENNGLTKSA